MGSWKPLCPTGACMCGLLMCMLVEQSCTQTDEFKRQIRRRNKGKVALSKRKALCPWIALPMAGVVLPHGTFMVYVKVLARYILQTKTEKKAVKLGISNFFFFKVKSTK